MPAQFSVDAQNLKEVLRELSQVDPNLRKELRAEMRSAARPLLNDLKTSVPKSAPLSGFRNAKPTRRDGKANYARWGTVSGSIKTPLDRRTKKPGFYPVVSIQFKSAKGKAGYEIMELAGSKNMGRSRNGLTPQGRAMIQNLNSRASMQGGLGRFAIPAFRGSSSEAEAAAKKVLESFAAKVNRRLK